MDPLLLAPKEGLKYPGAIWAQTKPHPSVFLIVLFLLFPYDLTAVRRFYHWFIKLYIWGHRQA